jgi:glycine/D-amino acid oxidase-like deaminating enzyme
VFVGDNVTTWAPPEYDDSKASAATWLDVTQVRELEPHLHPIDVGGWWFPEDFSVDAQQLMCSLKAAFVGLGVEFTLHIIGLAGWKVSGNLAIEWIIQGNQESAGSQWSMDEKFVAITVGTT